MITETRTKHVVIDLSDDPDDDIRIARMEMELFTWRQELKSEGYRVTNIDMDAIDSHLAIVDGEIKPTFVVFKVIVTITPKEK